MMDDIRIHKTKKWISIKKEISKKANNRIKYTRQKKKRYMLYFDCISNDEKSMGNVNPRFI